MEKIHKEIKCNQNAWLKPYIDIKTDLEKTKNDSEKIFLRGWIALILEKSRKMWENVEILNLSQQEEETILRQNQIIILQRFSQNIRDTYD